MSQSDARRARWRADLHDYGAEALRTAGLPAMADEHADAAAQQRTYAHLMDALAAAKAGCANNPGSEWHSANLRVVKLQVCTYRQTQRLLGAPRPGVIDNFSEPSDAELIAQGY